KPHWQILAELAARLNSTTVEALDDMMLWAILGLAVGVPETRCEHVTHEEAMAKIGGERGPERLLDLMLRAGPYGDRFDDGAEGLSLAKLRDVPHAVDLGALKPRRLPDILKTPGRRIPLADPLLAADVERLAKRLEEHSRPGGLLLVGRRQMRNMNSWLHNVEVLASGKNRCTLLIHPEDAARAGIEEGGRACVRSRVGEVVVEVEVSDEMMPGVVSLPHGFGHDEPGVRLSVASRLQPGVNSNLLADEMVLDELSGTSVLCGIPVTVEPA
ncbi:MAG: molybdopterin oxidoreductase family protein, partial [Deltaproteobacteria bacterium]